MRINLYKTKDANFDKKTILEYQKLIVDEFFDREYRDVTIIFSKDTINVEICLFVNDIMWEYTNKNGRETYIEKMWNIEKTEWDVKKLKLNNFKEFLEKASRMWD